MRIAIVGPSPVPFTIGGVENLLWGLCHEINQNTDHMAELIKLPSIENDFWSLINNYYNYYQLDLSYFDLVITTKYPSWMVRHKKSICYMIHTLRGLYDTYHFTNQPLEVDRSCKEINVVLDYMDKNTKTADLNEFFEMVFALRGKKIPLHYFDFPAPFIRKLVHYMDQWALSKNTVQSFCSISETVKKRTAYFPPKRDVAVVYPPSNLESFSEGEFQYIFIVSRLDAPKRIDMLIRAMKYVQSDIELLIAGTGPQEKQLKELAGNDKRIKFLGFVRDEDIEKYYANCLVIPYFPYDEDYGLITIEAMSHKKPVITTVDSGGPTEFVVNNETGFITKFNEKAIGEKIEYIAKHISEAKRMGENAYNRVKNITWGNVVMGLGLHTGQKELTKTNLIDKRKEHNKKITITSSFPIYPPQGGGQARTYNLYKQLANKYDIEIVSFTNVDQKEFMGEIAPGLKEIRTPKSAEHQKEEYKLENKAGIVISDIAMLTLSGCTKTYGERLKKSMSESNLIIISHPYLYEEVKKYLNGKKFIYEAQDVEYILKKEMLPSSKVAEQLFKQVYQTEKECCEKSELIMTCSMEDQITLNKVYGVPIEKMIIVPNGVDCENTVYTNLEDRLNNRKKLGLENEKIAIFMGSWHQPNLDACEEIFKIAEKCPKVHFLLMGSQCLYFKNSKLPDNVGMLGIVSEEEKNNIFSIVDFALNPMKSGSGTNLKMFDYMAAGIPIITTEFGTRGIENKEVFMICEINDMCEKIDRFDLRENSEIIETARSYVKTVFDWGVIVNELELKISKLLI